MCCKSECSSSATVFLNSIIYVSFCIILQSTIVVDIAYPFFTSMVDAVHDMANILHPLNW